LNLNPTLFLLSATITFALFAFGGYEGWAQSVIGLLGVFIFLSLLATQKDYNRSNPELRPCSPPESLFFLFLVFLFLSTVPLPSSAIKMLSPETHHLWNLSGERVSLMTFSLNRYATLKRLSILIVSTGLFISFKELSLQSKKRVLLLIAILGAVVAFIGILGIFYPSKKVYWLRPVKVGHPLGPFINRNHFAGFLNLSFFLTAGLLATFQKERKWSGAIFALIILPLLLTGIFLSLSRSGFVGFALGLFTLLILSLFHPQTRKSFYWLVPAFLVGFLAVKFLGFQKVLERVSTLQDPLSSITVQMRLAVWRDGLNIFRKYPFFGTGLGTASCLLPVYKTSFIHRYFANVENEYIELLLETGILGFLLLLLFFLVILTPIKTPPSSEEWDLRAGALAAIFASLAQSFFDFHLNMPAVILPFALSLGLVSKPKTNFSKFCFWYNIKWSKMLLFFTGIFLLIFNARQLSAEYHLFRAQHLLNQNLKGSLSCLQQAIRLEPRNPELFYQLGIILYKNGWKVAFLEKRKPAEVLVSSYQTLKEASRRSPADWRIPYYQTWVAEGLVRLGYPEWKNARDSSAELTMVLNPTEYLIFLNFSELYQKENSVKANALRRRAQIICPWIK